MPPSALRGMWRPLFRSRDARLDAEIQEAVERDMGLIEDDQPTALSHLHYVERMEAEFTPAERSLVRYALGLGDEP